MNKEGILLKATTMASLQDAEAELNRFFEARIEQLEFSGSAQLYEAIIDDIKEQTRQLKDRQDCPYINLVYSEKLMLSCLALRKYGYLKPY